MKYFYLGKKSGLRSRRRSPEPHGAASFFLLEPEPRNNVLFLNFYKIQCIVYAYCVSKKIGSAASFFYPRNRSRIKNTRCSAQLLKSYILYGIFFLYSLCMHAFCEKEYRFKQMKKKTTTNRVLFYSTCKQILTHILWDYRFKQTKKKKQHLFSCHNKPRTIQFNLKTDSNPHFVRQIIALNRWKKLKHLFSCHNKPRTIQIHL
jgi:hypothetical protein